MKLWAYDLGGNDNTSTVGSFTETQLSGNKPFKVQDSMPSGYVDVSSIVNWHTFGSESGKDYKSIRKEINLTVSTDGWGNLTLEEKQIAARIFCASVSKSERDEVYSEDELRLHSLGYFQEMQTSRKIRISRAQAEIFLWLSNSEAHQIVTDIIPDGLIEEYIYYGREGSESGDPDGLYDYIDATIGTTYATGGAGPLGLRAQNLTPHGRTLDQLCDDILDILRGLL